MVCGIVEDDRKYVYDLSEGRIRKRSPEEVLDYFKRYETAPSDRIRGIISWEGYEMQIETSSTVLGIKFDSTRKRLTVELSGTGGTSGVCDVKIPKGMATPSDIQVYLDNQPIDFSIVEQTDAYYLHIEYTHSVHTINVDLVPARVRYAQPLGFALIAVAVVIVIGVIGAVYWFKHRR